MSETDPTKGSSFIKYERAELDQSVPDRFEKIVAIYPDRLAVKDLSGELSYADLNRAANHVAHVLLRRSGEIQESVGLFVEDDCQAIVAMLGVLKSGKFYVPLDASFPATRISAVLDDSQIRVIITERQYLSWVQDVAGSGCAVICLEDLDADRSAENPRLSISPDAIGAVLYTSGSTGRPKGVIQNHRNFLHRVMVDTNFFGIGRDDRLSLVSAPTYSASLRPIFGSLLNGATIFPYKVAKEGIGRMGGWLGSQGISIYMSVPSVFRSLVGSLSGGEDFSSLRIMKLGGESVTKLDADLYKRHFPSRCVLVNSLGANETGVMRLYVVRQTTEVTETIVPAGYPVDDKEILILDESGQKLGFNKVGEIAVRSAFLSPGYWRQPDVTASAFRTDPTDPQLRIYRTGDLGCLLPDGCLLYKGRNQFRPKIHGIRVETEEVERVLHSHPSIKEAVVVVREEEFAEDRIIAHVVPLKNTAITAIDVRNFLAERLPAHMVPSVVIAVDPLPRNASGKIDRQALSRLDEVESPTSDIVAVQDPVERALKTMWEVILGISLISVQSSFFDLGGDSLTALRLLVSVRKAFGKDIPPAAIFRSPTIQQLAALIRQREATNYWSSLVPVQPVGSKPPFFWIHGDFSSVFLSRHLGSDQPLYLLTHQSEDGKPARYKDVESIAEYYLREILTVQKAGPFFLGGYSFGGVVALEIAQQLTRQGEEVGLLTLLDPPPLNRQTRLARSNDRESINDTFRRHARALAALTVKEQVDYIVPRAKEMFASWMSPMRKAFRKLICRACVTFGWSIPLYMRSSYILGVYQQALNTYVPRPYSGPVLLFKGETRSYSSKLDWYELLNGRVETHMVSGDHTKLRERSYVSTWAGQLKPALLAAQSAYSAQTPRGVHQ